MTASRQRACLLRRLLVGLIICIAMLGSAPQEAFATLRNSLAASEGPSLQLCELRSGLSRHFQTGPCSVGVGLVSGMFCCISLRRGRRLRWPAVRTALEAVGDSVPAGTLMKLFSPAKVNLFLRIIRRRPDGYHDLASLFHTVAFGDDLELEVLPESAEKDELKCNLPGVPVDDSNLVIRALNLFREKSGVKRHFGIKLEKSIPAQAGMGGGSSNAATAFFGANALCGNPASPQELLEWGDDPVIGSDATFFLSEGTAYCTGRGEIVTPVDALKVPRDLSIYLVKPAYGISTPACFKALDLESLSSIDPEELLKTFQEKGTAHSSWVNDLEAPAFQVNPNLGELKEFLGKEFGFEAVLMSGSGSTIYCVGDPNGGTAAFEAATKERFDIEGIWKTQLMRRPSPTEWYSKI